MPLPSVNPKIDLLIAASSPAQRAQIEAAWADILTHEDIGGRNADYARRTRLREAVERIWQ